tara:strand:- start:3706 stop:4566 length:861 start_codon:yes stop_codon:yes gene_type:complete
MKQKILLVGANGYIGSHLYKKLKHKFNIYPIDNLFRKTKKQKFVIKKDYRNLNEKFLKKFSTCVWLSGHSSVQQSVPDPFGAIDNNLNGLIKFKKIFKGRLIYASSGSVYSQISGLCDENTPIGDPTNIYDFTKVTIDKYFQLTRSNCVSLRFGTVLGPSENIRTELLLNNMTLDAITKKKVFLANPNVFRPILYIEDLVDAIEAILKRKNNRHMIYNLCSVNLRMIDYAKTVSKQFRCKIQKLKNTNTYNFKMSNKRFCKEYNFEFTKNISKITTELEKFYLKTL